MPKMKSLKNVTYSYLLNHLLTYLASQLKIRPKFDFQKRFSDILDINNIEK